MIKDSMTDAMDVDLPFTIDPLTIQLAQTDEDILALVLLRLAQAKSTSSDTVSFDVINVIRKLGMHDLRPDLASGKYDDVASQVLNRISLSRVGPSLHQDDHIAVVDAFQSEYLGDTSVLQKAIDQVIDDKDLYANAIPFVQSSGTGKSKLIQELAKTFFVLTLNLRENDRVGDFSFPRPDGIVRDYLQGDFTVPPNVDASACWRLRYAAFLCAIFDILITIIQEGIIQPSEFAKKFEETTRSAYLTQIVDKSRLLEEKFLNSLLDKPDQICARITRNSLDNSARNFFKELRQKHPSERPPPLVLALDEAHVMCDRRASGSLLNIFSSVLADLKISSNNKTDIIHFATIFLSTNSELNKVAPSSVQIASQRSQTLRMAGALTCVPYDVFVDKKKECTVADISTLKFIGNFGRPLFGALMNHGVGPPRVLNIAKEKLAHAKSPISLQQLQEKHTAYALIGRRVVLHFRPLQSSALTMGSDLIAHHMQVAYVVPIHRRFVVSGSPSEPFLVEAAAHLMATEGFSTISCLLNFINEDLVDAGEIGEIVGRSLTIEAYDIALRGRMFGTEPIYHSWVPVLDFLKELFDDSVYQRIIKTKPFRQPKGRTLGRAFSNAVVRLTHYARLSQVNLFNSTNVRKAFLRGMGLVGAQSQKLVDILIPVLFVSSLQEDPSTWVVEEGKMSQIMANWKNKAEDATPPHTDPYDIYRNLNTEQPTILLWHQFGSKKSEAVLPHAEKVRYPWKTSVYFIDLYGIGPEVYKGITKSNQEEYRQVIGCGDIYRDAPYTFPDYITQVEHTLPRWSADSFEQTAG